jgi:hypothetical protein
MSNEQVIFIANERPVICKKIKTSEKYDFYSCENIATISNTIVDVKVFVDNIEYPIVESNYDGAEEGKLISDIYANNTFSDEIKKIINKYVDLELPCWFTGDNYPYFLDYTKLHTFLPLRGVKINCDFREMQIRKYCILNQENTSESFIHASTDNIEKIINQNFDKGCEELKNAKWEDITELPAAPFWGPHEYFIQPLFKIGAYLVQIRRKINRNQIITYSRPSKVYKFLKIN